MECYRDGICVSTHRVDHLKTKLEQVDVDTVTDDAHLPVYETALSSGADVFADLLDPLTIAPGERFCVPTGVRMTAPPGTEIQVRPKSGLALKKGLTVLNSPGTIDGDYTGIIGVILINHSKDVVVITPGMKIAQLVLCPVYRMNLIRVGELKETARGDGGFGSTGDVKKE